ncbi:MAG: ferredoxin [Calditrichaeota bacterium]|nr:ferredoxin [Calditrichota bacterium]
MELIQEIDEESRVKTKDQKDLSKKNISDSEIDSSDLLNELDKIANQFEVEVNQAATEQTTKPASTKLHYEESKKNDLGLDDIKHNHLKFHITGQSENTNKPDVTNLIPALSAPFTNFEQFHYDFPMLIKTGSENSILPLKDYLEKLVIESGLNKDEKENLRLLFLKLEIILKTKAKEKTTFEFKLIWDMALKNLMQNKNSHKQKSNPVKEYLKSVSGSIADQCEIISYNKGAELTLFKVARLKQWQTKMAPFVNELESLVHDLKNIIKVSKRSAGESFTPNALESTMGQPGQDDLDFNSLSEIVTKSFANDALPPQRIERIKAVISKLNRWFKIISSSEQSEKFLDKLVADSTAKALKIYQHQKEELISFYKAIRIAKLEIEHRYDEGKHNPFFDGFSSLFLSEEDWSHFPPIILYFKASEIKSADKADLIDVLASKMPIKVLVTVDDLYNSSTVFDESFYSPGWSAVLGKMALSVNTTFVLQFPLSHMVKVFDEIEQGLSVDRPALFSVFDGFDQATEKISPFLRSAAASESRAFPLFYYNPKQGNSWAAHFSIAKSSQHKSDWPEAEIEIMDGDSVLKEKLTFSLGDFLAGIERYNNHFLPIPRSEWHSDLVPLTEYIHFDFENTNKSIPYILMSGDDGSVQKVIVTKTMCRLCANAQTRWNRIQELSGINNSHVIEQVEKEREKLASEMQEKLTEQETKHKNEMEQSLEGLTNDIISNIASGLLSDEMISIGSGNIPATSQASPAPKSIKEPEADKAVEKEPEAVATEEEEDEDLSFSDPYIDTPLCTSCNDCCNVNSQMFVYDENKQAFIKDPKAGTYKDLVTAAEKCPVKIIHPGKPLNPDEPGLEELIKEAEKYN